MKNFVRFLRAYEALIGARQAAYRFSVERVSPYFEDEFYAARQNVSTGIDTALDVLLEWFDEHFPKNTADAAHSDQFSYPMFFEMLKKHPELVESNEENLQSLLCSLKAKGLYGTGLESVPAMSEFVTEKLELKKTMVEAALKELEQVENEAVKIELTPVRGYLTARRPLARPAYFKLLSMCGNMDKDTESYKHVEQAKQYLDRV